MVRTESTQNLLPEQLLKSLFIVLAIVIVLACTIHGAALFEKKEEKPVVIALLPELDSERHAVVSDPMHDEEAFPGHLPNYAFSRHIRQVATETGVAERVIYAVTKAESRFKAKAQSRRGAVGLMQVVAHTGGLEASKAVLDSKRKPTRDELEDPYTNLRLGTTYLQILENRYLNHVEDVKTRSMLVLAAYNWGPTNVRALVRRHKLVDAEQTLKALRAHAPKETYNYVKKVVGYMQEFEDLHKIVI